jgi:MATE family multidrug resistance protein
MSVQVQARALGVPRARARGGVGEVALLAYPVVIQTIAETAMAVADTAMVGRLGATELGAVGFAGLWLWTLFVPFTGTATGVQAFVSRHDGADEQAQCGRWLWQALWLVVPAMTLWMLAIDAFLPPLVAWIGPSPGMQSAALDWSRACLPRAPALAANFALMAFLRGLGDTRTPLVATLAGVAVNLASAYVLIFGELGFPALGVVGAGLALTCGSWTIFAILLFAVLRPGTRARYHTAPCAPDPAAMLRFLRTSAPIGGQWALDMTTFAIFGSIIARMGDVSAAASQAMLQLLSISFMQAVAISLAAGTLIGRYIGADDLPAAQRSYRSAQQLGLVLAALVALLFVTLPETLIGLFSRDSRVLELARSLLVLAALFQVADAVGIVASGSLRGAGDTRWPFAAQATLAWVLRLPAVYVGAIWLDGGVLGAWIGELVYILALAAAFTLRFRAGHWRRVTI